MVTVMLLRRVTLLRELVISLWTGSLDKTVLLLREVRLFRELIGSLVGNMFLLVSVASIRDVVTPSVDIMK